MYSVPITFCKFKDYCSSILFLNPFASEIYKTHFDKTYAILDSFPIHEVLTQIFGHVSVQMICLCKEVGMENWDERVYEEGQILKEGEILREEMCVYEWLFPRSQSSFPPPCRVALLVAGGNQGRGERAGHHKVATVGDSKMFAGRSRQSHPIDLDI